MGSMFSYADEFNQNIGNWDVSQVLNMSGMFRSAINFNNSLAMWDVSNCMNFRYMFEEARNFNINLSSWCVSQIPIVPTDGLSAKYTGFATGSPLENQTSKHPKWGQPC